MPQDLSVINVPVRKVKVVAEADVVVAGGGAAGIAAAVSAAREGANVVLIERLGFLGGTMTAATLGGICGLYSLVDGQPAQLVFGFADEIRHLLETHGGTTGPKPWLKTASLPYDVFILKRIFDRLVDEKRITVFFHSTITHVDIEDGRIGGVAMEGPGGAFAVRGNAFIDCTGDADLCQLAGVGTEFSPEELQFPSMMFRLGGVDTSVVGRMKRERLHDYLENAVSAGFDLPRTAGGIYSVRDGVVHLNITRVSVDGRAPDPFDPKSSTRAEIAGREQVEFYLEAFRQFVPGFDKAYVLDTGCEIGVRESRRLAGQYVMTSDDIYSERKFADAIAVNCWPVEEHGVGRGTNWGWLSPGGYCHIPYRSLLPRGADNLLVAGRCLSADHVAQASLRVTANCFAMGQAAGIAAAMAADGSVGDVAVSALQDSLTSRGAVLAP